MQQLWIQIDAKVFSRIMKHTFSPSFHHHHWKVLLFSSSAHLFPDLWDMWMINGIRNAVEVLSLRFFFLISRGWFVEWDAALVLRLRENNRAQQQRPAHGQKATEWTLTTAQMWHETWPVDPTLVCTNRVIMLMYFFVSLFYNEPHVSDSVTCI